MGKLLRISEGEIGLAFVSETEMKRLNRLYLGKNRPTDVLSFPSAEQEMPRAVRRVSPRPYLGDVIVCPTYASRDARRRSIDPREELIRLLVHGILHVRGYDHCDEAQEARMFALQERAVESIAR